MIPTYCPQCTYNGDYEPETIEDCAMIGMPKYNGLQVLGICRKNRIAKYFLENQTSVVINLDTGEEVTECMV